MDHHHVKIIEKCGVSPPPSSIPSTTIPLTFLDILMLPCVPVQIIFFYDFPHSTNHFLQNLLPNIKHSLSLTLQHFFPFAAKFVFPPKPQIPFLLCSNDDSVSFTIAESTQDFHLLISDTPKDVKILQPLVSEFPPTSASKDGTMFFPLMAIQFTIIPNCGFTLSFNFRHVVADATTFTHFIRFWVYVYKTKGNLDSIGGSVIMPNLPLHNRDIIKDSKGLKLLFLEYFWNSSMNLMEFNHTSHNDNNKVRVTCVLRRHQIVKLKEWISIKCKNYGLDLKSSKISNFAVTCSLIWVCMVKSEEKSINDDDEIYNWTFVADCRDHPELLIPSNYFGNCLVARTVSLKRSKLVGENGIVEAMFEIEDKVRDFQREPLKGVERILSDFAELAKLGKNSVSIAGATKFGGYESDFGWGKPKKIEIAHIEYSNSISFSRSREKDGGVEVGIVLESIQMNNFNEILEEFLRNVSVGKSNL